MEREIDTRTSWHVVTQNCRVEDVSCKGACKSVILGVILGSACKSKPIPFPTTGVCTTLRQRVWKKYQNVSDQYPYWHLLTFAIFCIECTSTSTLQVCPLICSCIEAILSAELCMLLTLEPFPVAKCRALDHLFLTFRMSDGDGMHSLWRFYSCWIAIPIATV